MATYITGVRMSPPAANDHQHISHVGWHQSTESGICTTAEMVAFIEKGNTAWVNGTPNAQVLVVPGPPKYLRTRADNTWTNNLLSLPRI